MTNEDIHAAVELAEESAFGHNAAKALHSLTTKVGNMDRERHSEINAVMFLRTMERLNGTFVWKDGPKRGNKYNDVFQALAAEMPEFAEKSLIEKSEHVQEFGPRLRSGFYATRKWLTAWYEDTVFCVPSNKESGVLTVITLDREQRVRLKDDGTPDETSPTAAEMQQIRDEKLAIGQVSASAKRMRAATKDKTVVKSRISAIVDRALAELDASRGSRMLADQTE
jgi:hypothetical protein